MDADFEWQGAGVGLPDAHALINLKGALFKLFKLMPEGFTGDLRTAILSGRFYTWMVAPLIGGGCTLELHGMPDRDDKMMMFEWGNALIDIGQGEQARETHDGYRWLVSLYKRDTFKANRATVAWIDEWLAHLAAAEGTDERD